MQQVYGVVGTVNDIMDLLQKVNPNVTFFQWEAFNIRTEKHETQKQFYLHDTADKLIANALGQSLGELYAKAELLNPKNKAQA
jgi:hypothetical protein